MEFVIKEKINNLNLILKAFSTVTKQMMYSFLFCSTIRVRLIYLKEDFNTTIVVFNLNWKFLSLISQISSNPLQTLKYSSYHICKIQIQAYITVYNYLLMLYYCCLRLLSRSWGLY